MSDRVRAALLELLPSGSASLEAVSKNLAVSTRTFQRRNKYGPLRGFLLEGHRHRPVLKDKESAPFPGG